MNMKMKKILMARPGTILILCLLLLASTSCKNENSGNDNSFFSFGSDEVTTLGNADLIQQVLSSEGNTELSRKDSVMAFYENRSFQPAWQDPNLREELLNTFEEAQYEGLYSKDYHGEEIKQKLEDISNLSDEEQSRLDVLLTDAFFKFGDHLLNGKTNPQNLHEIWDVPKNKINTMDLLERTLQEGDLSTALEQLRPNHIVYSQLVAASKEYQDLKKEFNGFENIPEGETVEAGDEDERLPQIQERLKFFGHLEEVDSTNTSYNEKIQDAIKRFQEDNGIEADGIIGNGTIKMLNKGYDERHNQILVNLERWRWYPRDLGEHYIIVNIANYRLEVVKNGDTVATHKTMVGTEARKTPVFSEEIDHIVYNPTWTIPPTIKTKDVIPGMRNNSNYLSSKNIQVYDQSGSQVDPSSIDWNSDMAKSYTYRQEPGSSNPLGRVKIMYPNEYLIYLHDTPSKALFQRDSRAQSSGCVRVEDAIGLSKYLLSDQEEYTSEEIDKIIAGGKTKQIPMKQKVKVYHFYWTAWKENGKTRFTEDIYNYDSKTLEAIKIAS